jgi:hypothetical protein
MNRYFFSLVILLTSVIAGKSQVTTDNRPMVTGVQPALILQLKGADPKFVEAKWKEYTKNYGKVEKVKGSKESVIQGIHIGEIGGGELLNVYNYSAQAADGTELTVWFSRGGAYLTAKDPGYPKAENFLKAFAIKVNADMIALDLEEQQKKLEKLESAQAKLVKENENLHKVIADNNAKIEQANIDIPLNERSQEVSTADVTNQKAVVESVKDNPEEYKMQQKLLAKLESTDEKLKKENASLHKVIADSEAKIKQAELDITANQEAQTATQAQIEEQEKVVELVNTKYNEAKAKKPE